MEKTHACLASSIESSAVDAVSHRLPNHFLAQAAMWTGTATLALGLFNATTGTPLSIPFPATSASSRPQVCSAQVRHRDAGLPRREPTGP